KNSYALCENPERVAFASGILINGTKLQVNIGIPIECVSDQIFILPGGVLNVLFLFEYPRHAVVAPVDIRIDLEGGIGGAAALIRVLRCQPGVSKGCLEVSRRRRSRYHKLLHP